MKAKFSVSTPPRPNERTVIAFIPPKSAAPVPPAPVVEKITNDALRAALSWQERKLVFSETPLRDVVAQFNRRNRLQLILLHNHQQYSLNSW